MKRRVSTFKLLFLLGSFCVTMWQLPRIIGAVDGAKAGDMGQMLKMFGGGSPNTASAAAQDPERINDLLDQLGMPAVGGGETGREKTGEPPILFTPGDEAMTPEEARAMIEQQRREALERSGRPVDPESDTE